MIKKSTLERIIGDDLSEMWNALHPKEKRIITENFKYEQYKKNQIIYAEKETPENLYCLLAGKVKLYKSGIGDRVQILRLYRPVQYFGYRAYFAKEPYVSTAAAFEPSVIGIIPMQVVEDLVRQNNDLAMFTNFHATSAVRIQRLSTSLRNISEAVWLNLCLFSQTITDMRMIIPRSRST